MSHYVSWVKSLLCSVSALSFVVMGVNAVSAQDIDTDFVFVVDESGSMQEEQSGIASAVQGLDAQISTFSNPQYGLVGYGGNIAQDGRVINVGSGLFGNATEFATAAQQLTISGGTEDGYSGLQVAFDNHASAFRAGSERSLVIVTDEDRDNTNPALSRQSLEALAAANDVSISGGIAQQFFGPGGESLIGVYNDDDGNLVGVKRDAGGNLQIVQGASAGPAAGTTQSDYLDLILATDGVALDISQFDQLGAVAGEFFVATLLAPTLLAQTEEIHTDILEDAGEEEIRTQARRIRHVMSRIVEDRSRTRFIQRSRGGLAGGDDDGFAGSGRLGATVDGTLSDISSEVDNERRENRDLSAQLYVDYLFNDNLILGGMFGVSHSDYKQVTVNGSRESNGPIFGAYGIYYPSDKYAIQVIGTLSPQESDIEDQRLFFRVTGTDVSSLRANLSAGVTRFDQFGPVDVFTKIDLSYSMEDFEDYTASDGTLVSPDTASLLQLSPRVEAIYNFPAPIEGVSAKFELGAEWDIAKSPDTGDDFSILAAVGLEVRPNETVSYGVRAGRGFIRDDENGWNFGGYLNFRF